MKFGQNDLDPDREKRYVRRGTPRAYVRHYFQTIRIFLVSLVRRRRTKVLGRRIVGSRRANRELRRIVRENRNALVSRLGTTEASALVFFIENETDGECIFPAETHRAMRTNSGFFPESDVLLSRFCRESLEHLKEINYLGIRANPIEKPYWELETQVVTAMLERPMFFDIEDLLPMGSAYSWTEALAGLKVLVVHPFESSIRSQYAKRVKLFPGTNFLPDFQLDTLRTFQTAGDNQGAAGLTDWFQALEIMRNELTKRDFEIALIGAGAYGLFLASECKKLGKTAIHIGGATQLLFGIHGKRWTHERKGSSQKITPLINDNWASPLPEETPINHDSVEGGGYWE